MSALEGHIEFNGTTRTAKFWLVQDGQTTLRHIVRMHADAVGDPGVPDPYGHLCKCPPGEYYVGAAEACATRNADGTATMNNGDDAAYGCWFSPLLDRGPLAAHNRAGNGVHGGGTALPDPFAPQQGWYWTEGCLRLQNSDNEQIFVPFVRTVRAGNPNPDTAVRLTVSY